MWTGSRRAQAGRPGLATVPRCNEQDRARTLLRCLSLAHGGWILLAVFVSECLPGIESGAGKRPPRTDERPFLRHIRLLDAPVRACRTAASPVFKPALRERGRQWGDKHGRSGGSSLEHRDMKRLTNISSLGSCRPEFAVPVGRNLIGQWQSGPEIILGCAQRKLRLTLSKTAADTWSTNLGVVQAWARSWS